MSVDLKRTAWKFLLDLTPGSRTLVLGGFADAWRLSLQNDAPGVSLAPDDVSWHGHRSAFADRTFDLIVVDDLDGALAQAGGSLKDLMAECRRILKRSGTLALVLNNRSELRYRRRGNEEIRNIALGTAYRHLRRHDFTTIDTWVLAPNIASLRYLWPVSTPQRAAGADVPTLSERIFYWLTRSLFGRWFISSALIVASVGKEKAPSIGERIAKKVAAPDHFEITRIRAGNPSSAMYKLHTEHGGIMIRLPIDASARQRCEVHWQALRILDVPEILPGMVPRALASGELDGQPYFCEAVIDGIAIDSPRYPLNRIMREGAQLLMQFQRRTMISVEIDKSVFDRHCGAVFRDLEHAGAPPMRLNNIYRYLQTQLIGVTLPLVFAHGDYKIENFMIDARSYRIKGIIDWDLAQPRGLPLLDLLYLFAYAEITARGSAFPRVFIEKVLPMRWGDDKDRLLAEYLRVVPLPPLTLTALAILFWLYHIAYRYQIFRWPSAATPRYFDDILQAVDDHIANESTLAVNGASNA